MAKAHNSDGRFTPLKTAPKYFDDERVEIWKEVIENCPLELKRADTYLVEQLTQLIFRARNGTKMLTGSEMSQQRHILAELDMTPKSRRKPAPEHLTKTKGNQVQPSGAGKFTKYGTPPRPKKTK